MGRTDSAPKIFKGMKTVSFYTFGCKLNQSESAGIIKSFVDRGYRVVSMDKSADVCVLNTCTVTERSDAKVRKAVRHVLKQHPETTIIVSGCYSQVAPYDLLKIRGIDYILGTDEKFKIFDYFSGPGKQTSPKIRITPAERLHKAESRPGEYLNHTRAFLKIQDGCNHRCSYCIVPFARGPSRSVPIVEVMQQAELLFQKGYKEIVLTGVHIGEYGRDLSEKSLLLLLLQQLHQLEGIGRIRLSSLDPEDITDDLLEFCADSEKICRHFHIPLQSGCDSILRAMNRQYTTKGFREKVDKITATFQNVGIGTDIIVGFPGETDAQFDETYRFIENLSLTYLHIFPFSIRKGTEAASMKNQVAAKIRMERAKKLRKLGELKRRQFMSRWKDETVNVLLESRTNKGWMSGFSSEYLRVEVPLKRKLTNQFVCVHVNDVSGSHVRGEVIENE